MSLKFAILTALVEQPSTGLELTRRFDRSFGYFWHASHQQIYRELKQLEAHGMIREVPSSAPPTRGLPRRFEASAGGRAILVEWIGQDDDPRPERLSVAVRVRAAAATGTTETLRSAIEHHLIQRQASLATYEQIEARDFGRRDPGDPSSAMQYAVLRSGLLVEQAWIDWCHEVLDMLDELQ